MNLLPNETLIAMMIDDGHAGGTRVGGYAFAVRGTDVNDRDQVQHWILFSRSAEDRPPKQARVSFINAEDIPGDLVPPFTFSNVRNLDDFFMQARAAFETIPDTLLYVSANCASWSPTLDASGRGSFGPSRNMQPPFLSLPDPFAQADTGTRWLFQNDRLVGMMYTQKIQEPYTVEWWMLYDGFSDEADGFEVRLCDLGDGAPDTFLGSLARGITRGDTLVSAACVASKDLRALRAR